MNIDVLVSQNCKSINRQYCIVIFLIRLVYRRSDFVVIDKVLQVGFLIINLNTSLKMMLIFSSALIPVWSTISYEMLL